MAVVVAGGRHTIDQRPAVSGVGQVARVDERLACQQPIHRLSSNKVALITSDCGQMRSCDMEWPQSPAGSRGSRRTEPTDCGETTCGLRLNPVDALRGGERSFQQQHVQSQRLRAHGGADWQGGREAGQTGRARRGQAK